MIDARTIVVPVTPQDAPIADGVATQFGLLKGLSLSAAKESDNRFALLASRSGLSLFDLLQGRVVLDDNPPRLYKVTRKDPMGRAMGAKTKNVLDATAGLGTDTMLLATMQFRLTTVEQHPVVAALMLARLKKLPCRLIERIEARFADSLNVMEQWNNEQKPKPDVVYLDPMFMVRQKNALPPMDLQVLRELHKVMPPGDESDKTHVSDNNGESLLNAALRTASKRVVVKRPIKAAALMSSEGHAPEGSHRGKLIRYDVYIPSKMS